jgi:hypothetical protein
MVIADSSVSDDASIDGGESRPVAFRVTQAGAINVSSKPVPHPVHSESGSLGALALFRPGDTAPASRVVSPMSAGSLSFAYDASGADAELEGSWTCRVTNLTDDTAAWHTQITVGSPTLLTASFDLALLNGILETVVSASAVSLHLESDSLGGKRSVVGWSNAIRNVAHTDHYPFHVSDEDLGSITNPLGGDPVRFAFRIKVDSIPGSATLILMGDPLQFSVSISFSPGTLTGINTPDIDLRSLQLGINVMLDGQVFPTCTVDAVVPSLNNWDVSSYLTGAFESAIADAVARRAPADKLRPWINSFFGRVLRLEPDGQIQGYSSDGTSLLVTHLGFPPEPPVGPPVTGS